MAYMVSVENPHLASQYDQNCTVYSLSCFYVKEAFYAYLSLLMLTYAYVSPTYRVMTTNVGFRTRMDQKIKA